MCPSVARSTGYASCLSTTRQGVGFVYGALGLTLGDAAVPWLCSVSPLVNALGQGPQVYSFPSASLAALPPACQDDLVVQAAAEVLEGTEEDLLEDSRWDGRVGLAALGWVTASLCCNVMGWGLWLAARPGVAPAKPGVRRWSPKPHPPRQHRHPLVQGRLCATLVRASTPAEHG